MKEDVVVYEPGPNAQELKKNFEGESLKFTIEPVDISDRDYNTETEIPDSVTKRLKTDRKSSFNDKPKSRKQSINDESS